MDIGFIPTKEEADSLVGELYDGVQYFHPVQDGNDNWIVSTEEIDQCTNENCMWVKELELITWVPPYE